MSFRDRVDDAQRELQDTDGDAIALYPGPNTVYFADIFGEPLDRHLALVIPQEGAPYFVTPRKSLDLIRDESWVEAARVIEENDPGTVAEALVTELSDDVNTLLVDDRTPFSVTRPLQSAADVTLDSAGPLLESLRLRKDPSEVEALKESAAVADEVSKEVRAMGPKVVGMTERELADVIRGKLHAKGGTRLSFDIVVASGPNAARPYVRQSDRRIREGEPVIVDFGAFVGEYASDQTRTTVFAGEPPGEFEAAYDVVREALDAGVAAVEPGVTAGSIDDAAEAVIVEHGYEENLIHGTGHGVGLEAHEAPTIGGGNDTILEEGMVFSVEPGVYFEGEWGVRVEDLVVVTDDGCERLNHSPRTWEPL